MNGTQKMRVLVTGATGLIGSHLVERLLNDKVEVIAMGRDEEKIKYVFGDKLKDACFSYTLGNIADKFPEEAGNVTCIFHAASPISGQDIQNFPVNTIEANLSGTKNCLEYLVHQKNKYGRAGRLVVFSSATVYGSSMDRDRTVCEADTDLADSLQCGAAPYSESKRMIEVMVRAYGKQYGIDCVIARIGYVYGYTKLCPNTAFYEFLDKAVSGKDLAFRHTGMPRRDNIYIRDAVNGLILLAMKGNTGEAYNISSGGERDNFKSIDEMVKIIADCVDLQLHQKVRLIFPENAEIRKPGIMLDNHKLKTLGWSLETGIQEGITETVRGYIAARMGT
jgi:Nucleoside-diphosphate-sugar epimerases